MTDDDELKAARTQWRRRRTALKRRDPQYRELVEANDVTAESARDADRQAQFWGFHGPPEKTEAALRDLNRAWAAQDAAADAKTRYETDRLGPFPEPSAGPVRPTLTVVPLAVPGGEQGEESERLGTARDDEGAVRSTALGADKTP